MQTMQTLPAYKKPWIHKNQMQSFTSNTWLKPLKKSDTDASNLNIFHNQIFTLHVYNDIYKFVNSQEITEKGHKTQEFRTNTN